MNYTKPYPHLDYRVSQHRDRWHYCEHPWSNQCRVSSMQSNQWEFMSKWSERECKREDAKRVRWYERERIRIDRERIIQEFID